MSEEIKNNELLDEEVDFGEDIIQLINEDGETVDFYHVATIEFEDKWYVFFEPAEDLADIDEGEVVVFRLETAEDGEDLFVPIEDDDELNRVFDEYNRLIEEEGEEGCGCDCGDDCTCNH
ncbi:MAG: DUF1292 domain-containing protein [Clostridiales bacterium]|nr:DUF1292 domain-containing protein [Clostridiales bacterium]